VDVFPTQDLIDCSTTSLREDGDVILQYGRSPGYKPLLQWLAEEHGVEPDQVLTGNSSLEVLSFITESMVEPGDRVFVESPSYDRTITLIRRANAKVVGIPLEKDGIDLAAFEDALKHGVPKLFYIVADFQNPMGVTTSLEKRQRLAELAHRHGFWIVEDGPYRRLRYWGEDVPTLLSLAPSRVLHMSSFSKILAPGIRLGYVVGPRETITTLSDWAVNTYIGPVFTTQGMVYEYCRRGLLDDNIEHLKKVYRPRLEAMGSALKKHIPQVSWTQPEGGFFVSGMLPEGNDIVELQKRAAEAGLKLSDGRGFFPNPAEGRRFLRIPFCSLTPEEIEEGISRLARLL
jgi:2-aminoadipate transaminase